MSRGVAASGREQQWKSVREGSLGVCFQLHRTAHMPFFLLSLLRLSLPNSGARDKERECGHDGAPTLIPLQSPRGSAQATRAARWRTHAHAVAEGEWKEEKANRRHPPGHSPRCPHGPATRASPSPLPPGRRLPGPATLEETGPAFPLGEPPASQPRRRPGTRPVEPRGRRGLQLPACRARRRLRSAAGGGGLFSAEEEQGRGGRQRVRVQSSAAAARAHDSHMPGRLLHLW